MIIDPIQNLKKHGWLHFYQMDKVDKNEFISPILCKGKGIYVYDNNGKQYIDGLSGAYCVNVGYGRKNILEAALKAAEQIHFVSPFSAANMSMISLAEKLSILAQPITGDRSRVYFVNSGSEAIDTAIKIARVYARRTAKPNGYKIICRNCSYHGTTFGAMSCSGFDSMKEEFTPLVPGIYHSPNTSCIRCPLGLNFSTCNVACATAISDIINREGADSVAAVLVEPVETSNGIIPPPQGYLNNVSNICKTNNTLLIIDEVITGFGRLARWFGAEKYGINADIIVCAKGLTSGYDSLGAVIVREEVANVFSGNESKMFMHGSTFGGRPGATAAALETIKIIEDESLLETSENASLYIHNLLLKEIATLSIVGDIRCAGLLFGIDLIDTTNNLLTDHNVLRKIRRDLIEKGLITSMFAARNEPIIELAPPLIISKNEIDNVIDILYNTLKPYS